MRSVFLVFFSFIILSATAQNLKSFQDDKKLFGFKDKAGKVIVQPRFSAIGYQSEGMIAVKEGDKWGYIDTGGKMVIEPQFAEAGAFSEGKAVVGKRTGNGNEVLRGYINKTGKLILDYQWEIANNFKNGFAIIGIRATGVGSYFGVINTRGEKIISGPYTAMEDMSEGLFLVAQGSVMNFKAKYGFVDTTGKLVIPLLYQNGMGFSEGLASMQKDGKYGFIDKNNKVVIPFQYDGPGYFEKGKAQVVKDGVSLVINKAGKTVK